LKFSPIHRGNSSQYNLHFIRVNLCTELAEVSVANLFFAAGKRSVVVRETRPRRRRICQPMQKILSELSAIYRANSSQYILRFIRVNPCTELAEVSVANPLFCRRQSCN
jgi:hypothetical protein